MLHACVQRGSYTFRSENFWKLNAPKETAALWLRLRAGCLDGHTDTASPSPQSDVVLTAAICSSVECAVFQAVLSSNGYKI